MLDYSSELHIFFPDTCRQVILDHCRRALDAFTEGQAEKGKAFGLIFGTVSETVVKMEKCFPLQKNVRSEFPYSEYMDRVMDAHAIPSQTPLKQRGWVADPAELFARVKECREMGLVLLGTYHMHRVGWEHDTVRDTPTRLDAVLAEDSGLAMFIISMVEPEQPIIRAFYEGIKEREISIR